jgi:1-deoxy-D-xylulose-5-phosphate reductoisomerase
VDITDQRKSVVVLGATGSVGVATLDVIQQHPETFNVFGLAAYGNHERLLAQCLVHRPRYAFLADPKAAKHLRQALEDASAKTQVLETEKQLTDMVTDSEVSIVMSAIVGCAGLVPTLAAARAGKRILLANKESLVVAGALIMSAVERTGALILPIDSEHNAIYQCVPPGLRCGPGAKQAMRAAGVRKLFLMASGGPFRDWPMSDFEQVTPKQALNHPVWQMGPKISIDSATMMNKGLELIEACWLFDLTPDDIRVVVHPEAVIHGMVEYLDGSIIAQMAAADMRVPIAYGLQWPNRLASGAEQLNIFDLNGLSFAEPDLYKFPSLRLARQAMITGGSAPAILNAANEAAVAAFLAGRVGFTDIPALVEEALQCLPVTDVVDLETVLAVDQAARSLVEGRISAMASA